MTIKIKANEELFNRWQKIGRIITNLASIVQNDMEIGVDDLAEWEQLRNQSMDELRELYDTTVMQLRRDNGPVFILLHLQALELVLERNNNHDTSLLRHS